MLRRFLSYVAMMLLPLGAGAQYISQVLEYRPAPGQFINSLPWGSPLSASSLVGGVNGSLSLGAFGGWVVFRFEEAVVNDPGNPYGIDFTIFGNASSEWAEPGVVWVMKDENGNGLADDTWYELAGSDYHFPGTLREYSVRYTNPGGLEARDVPWSDLSGNSGAIRANSVHTQSYYPMNDSFPDIPGDEYTLSGSLIRGSVDVDHPPVIKSLRRSFGYADNQVRGTGPDSIPDNPYTPEVEHSGGDAFDIAWAVDNDGAYVDLELIHFIKVQNAMLHEGGWLGEVSTEITGAVDVAPDPAIQGVLDLLVIRDLPPEIAAEPIQLEVFMFHMGRPVSLPQVQWTCSAEWAVVDENHSLHLSGYGPLTITAATGGDPPLTASVSTLVSSDIQLSGESPGLQAGPLLYPNPAEDNFHLSGVEGATVYVYEAGGKLLRQVDHYRSGESISIQDFSPGLYFLKVGEGAAASFLKLLKQ